MIDLHSHLLPWVDAGAADLEEGLALLEASIRDGIELAVLTPTVEPGRWDNTASKLRRKFHAFCELAARRGFPIELRLGAEAFLTAETLALVESGEVPFVGRWSDHDVLLLRWREDFVPIGAVSAMHRLLRRHILPMIAHPERNEGIRRSPEALDIFVSEGCLVQVDAGSLLGVHGAQVQATAFHLVERGWVTAVASNASNYRGNPPRLSQVHVLLSSRYGVEVADAFLARNPGAIVGVEPAAVAAPLPTEDPEAIPVLQPEGEVMAQGIRRERATAH